MELLLLIQLTRANTLMEREYGHSQSHPRNFKFYIFLETSRHTYSMTPPTQAQSSMVSMDIKLQLETTQSSNINSTLD